MSRKLLLEVKNLNVSFHTYAGEVINNEEVIASGVCEEVTHLENGKKTYNLIIGTTRESINEYVKLEKSPLYL